MGSASRRTGLAARHAGRRRPRAAADAAEQRLDDDVVRPRRRQRNRPDGRLRLVLDPERPRILRVPTRFLSVHCPPLPASRAIPNLAKDHALQEGGNASSASLPKPATTREQADEVRTECGCYCSDRLILAGAILQPGRRGRLLPATSSIQITCPSASDPACRVRETVGDVPRGRGLTVLTSKTCRQRHRRHDQGGERIHQSRQARRAPARGGFSLGGEVPGDHLPRHLGRTDRRQDRQGDRRPDDTRRDQAGDARCRPQQERPVSVRRHAHATGISARTKIKRSDFGMTYAVERDSSATRSRSSWSSRRSASRPSVLLSA